jgi:2'-hydroxyisoflavone reductase
MKMLILGGTVFLSKAVAVAALRRGHQVTVASRGRNGEPPKVARHVTIDRNATNGLSALDGESFDAVVDVSNLPGHAGAALDALAERVAHWTYVSSVSAYSDNTTLGLTPATGSTHDPAPPDSLDTDLELFGPSKVACENLVRDTMGDKAFIVRPGLIVGPGDPSYRFGYWPDRLVAGGEILAPAPSQTLVQWIDVRDQADWIVHAAQNRLTGTFDAVCPPVSRADFIAGVAEGMGVTAQLTWVPETLLTEHGVAQWTGEQSIGMWLPAPDMSGMLSHDVTESLANGLTLRPVGESARDWFESESGNPRRPGRALTRDKEAEVLADWHRSRS